VRYFLIFLGVIFLFCLPAQAASPQVDAPHLRVKLVVADEALYAGLQPNDVGVFFSLEPGWHIYWMNPGDAGEPPHFHWTLPEGVTASAVQFPVPERIALGSMADYGYKGDVLFPVELRITTVPKSELIPLQLSVDWLVCKDSCIPGKADLELPVHIAPSSQRKHSSNYPIFKHFLAAVPAPLPAQYISRYQVTPSGLRLYVETSKSEESAQFFPSEPDIVSNAAPQKLTQAPNGILLDLQKDESYTSSPARLSGVIRLAGGRAYTIHAQLVGAGALQPQPVKSEPTAQDTGIDARPEIVPAKLQSPPPASSRESFSFARLFSVIGIAFIGGLLLNFMPCVFPVLFLKGLALLNAADQERHHLQMSGWYYASGILASFWGLALVLQEVRSAGAKLGWGFQFQSPIFIELMAGFLFLLALSLAGQFEIGISMTGKGNSLANRKDYLGSFFTGVLAVIVATPCTAPFMGAAIGYALAQPALVTFAVFTVLGLGLATPYLALTQHPSWTRFLPRPGAWMEILRHAVSLPLFATVIWLVWILAGAYGVNLAVGSLASFLLLAVAGYFLGRWPQKKWAATVATILILLTIGGVVGLSQKLRDSETQIKVQVKKEGLSGSATAWEPWSPERVKQYLAQGHPVFVDFSAGWCLSCQVNEHAVLEQNAVKKSFEDHHVVLLKADWTRHDGAITSALSAMGRSGVPTYALYAPGQAHPELLPEVLTSSYVVSAVGKLP